MEEVEFSPRGKSAHDRTRAGNFVVFGCEGLLGGEINRQAEREGFLSDGNVMHCSDTPFIYLILTPTIATLSRPAQDSHCHSTRRQQTKQRPLREEEGVEHWCPWAFVVVADILISNKLWLLGFWCIDIHYYMSSLLN